MSRETRKYRHECQEKIFRRLLKRLDYLWKLKYSKTKIDPISKGYYHTFIVRPDIARGPEGDIYQKILPMINEKIWSREKEFDPKERGWFSFSSVLSLRSISHEKYMTLSQKEKKLFNYTIGSHRVPDEQKRYCVKHPWKFSVITRKNYVTEAYVYDSLIDSEIKLICKKLDQNKSLVFRIRGKNYDRLDNWWSFRWYNRAKTKESFKNEILKTIDEENV